MNTDLINEDIEVNDINQEEIYPYTNLFSPLQIQDLKLNNRIIWAPPLEAGKIQPSLSPEPGLSAFLRERAAAGLGMAFVGQADSSAQAWGTLTRELNQHGCRLAVGISPATPSRRITTRRLNKLISEAKIKAAELCEAGVNALYLDAASGTFLSWLLARQDHSLSFYYKTGTAYLFNLVAEISKTLPAGFPLFLRATPMHLSINSLQNLRKIGLTGVLLQEENSFAGSLRAAKEFRSVLSAEGSGFFIFAEVGAAQSQPEACELSLMEEAADALVLSRALLAEPDWVSLAYTGQGLRQKPCILCFKYCAPAFFPDNTPGCSVNPRCGRENIYPVHLTPIYPAKSLAVIGAGPAGMQAALTAWERGYRVSLFDHSENPFHIILQEQSNTIQLEQNESDDPQDYKDEPMPEQEDSDVFVEGVVNLRPENDEADNTQDKAEMIDFSNITVGEAKQETAVLNETMSEAIETGTDSEKEAPAVVTQIPDDLPLNTERKYSIEDLRKTAWQRYSYYLLERINNAENSGELETFYQTEVTLAMLSNNRFDAIIVATGHDNSYDLFHLIQDSYVSPVVKIAGTAAGAKGIAEAIRSGYSVAANI